jgi:Glycosyl transferase family 2
VIGRWRSGRLSSRLAAIEAKVDSLAVELRGPRDAVVRASAGTGAEFERANQSACEQTKEVLERLGRLHDVLQLVYDREPELRERLARLRSDATYEHAFDDDNPLVSVVIATYDRGALLMSRAIPSVLAQTYENIEIVVIGDDAPGDTERWIAELGNPRIRYRNLPYRGPYPEQPRDLWHVAGVPPRNTAVALARGSWIAPLDDDDAFHPRHIEHLLELAQRGRHEVTYGLMRCLMNDGSEYPLGTYPPQFGSFGWQSAIFHAGLRIFEMELADALFFSPADWSLCRRMLRAGVRFSMLHEVVTDHYESRFAHE